MHLFSLILLINNSRKVVLGKLIYATELVRRRCGFHLWIFQRCNYVGIKGYFTDTTKLKKLNFSFSPTKISVPELQNGSRKEVPQEVIEQIKKLMESEKPYLDPELNLIDLAKRANMSRSQLSETINHGFQKNFNDFVNMYRIEAFKKMIAAEKHEQLSLLGIAYECGFNSKATFNRVFKKLTQTSPTEFLKAAV